MVEKSERSPQVGGDFELTDHFGRRVTSADYRGRFALIYFGFTHCKLVCPRALARISGALDRLGSSAAAVQPLYITVDPERDSPAALRAFLEERFPHFVGLTGSREEVDAVKSTYRVFARKVANPADPDGYDVPHSALTYLLDTQGSYRAHYADTVDEETLAERLRVEIAKDAPPAARRDMEWRS
ncbi:MAG TPA: SCO family protein [Alphaproteobacteria bacterium]|nr:SCO family protein [Alphaproteobacteria bacterium]